MGARSYATSYAVQACNYALLFAPARQFQLHTEEFCMQLKTLFDIAFKTQFARATIEHWAYGRRPAPAGFPSPIRVGRHLRYIEEEVDAWITSRAAARPGQEQATQLKDTATASSTPGRRRPGRPKKAEAAATMGVTYG